MMTGNSVPLPIDSFLKLLGASAPPCALVSLGLFLGESRNASHGSGKMVFSLTISKLIAQPLITWVLAEKVFHVSGEMTLIAVMLAALPTGTGPFMIAEFYNREASITAKVILTTTVLSLVTIAIFLSLALP